MAPPPRQHAPAPQQARQSSSSSAGGFPTARRNSIDGRPKREIHPPAPKDLPWAGEGQKRKSSGGRKSGVDQQMRYIKKELADIVTRKQYYEISYPFQYPVGA